MSKVKTKAKSKRVDLDVPEYGEIDHEKRTVDCDSWAEAGGSIGIYARQPVSVDIE